MLPDKYDLALYVYREQLFDEFREWFSPSLSEYRLRSLVGPIGIGKSWFVSHIHNELKDDPSYLPIWLDLSKGAVYPSSSPPKKFPDVAGGGNGRTQWLRWIIDQINEVCHPQITFDPSISFPAMLAHVIENLCQHCGSVIPILLVDGYDEVASEADRNELQELIFAIFWEQPCTRILIARRDIQELPHHILSWNEEIISLSGFNNEQQQHQVGKHLENPSIHDSLPQYLTENPYINSLIIDFAARKHPNPLKSSDFHACVNIITDRSGVNVESADILNQIAIRLQPTWTALTLRKNVRNRRRNVTIDDPILKPLFETGLIHHVTGTARYRIEVGLHSLLQFSLPKIEMETQHE